MESSFQSEVVEVIIINNGSTDETAKVVEEFSRSAARDKFAVVHHEFSWKDYSEAVRQGVLLASGEVIVWMGVDIDDLASIGRGWEVLKKTNADVVILSKYRGADWRPAMRVFLNRTYNFIARVLDGLWYSDVEGYMMIAARTKPLFNFLGFSQLNTINLNLLYYCKRLGLRVEEAPFYVGEKRQSVFLSSLPKIVWLDLKAVVLVHHRFKKFAEARPNKNRGIYQS
jgi:glycosyltransferase involved in cell wall biosynthesis